MLHVLLILVRRSLRIFSRIVRIAMFASLFHILVFHKHFPLIPWVVVVCRMYSSNFLVRMLVLLFRLLFPPHFLLFLAFPGSSVFPVCPRVQIVDVLSHVDWRFEGPAAVFAFVFEVFLLARILAF